MRACAANLSARLPFSRTAFRGRSSRKPSLRAPFRSFSRLMRCARHGFIRQSGWVSARRRVSSWLLPITHGTSRSQPGTSTRAVTRGPVTAKLTRYFRSQTLYEEPSFGGSNGLFENPWFANLGINLNYVLGWGVTAYGNLRNALNRHYEEVFGFPSPRLNFV